MVPALDVRRRRPQGRRLVAAPLAPFDAEDEVQYQLISIAAARKFGILPLAYKKE